MQSQDTIDGFCPICFEPKTKFITEENIQFKCSKCGSSIDFDEIKSLLIIAEDAVRHGYLYPRIEAIRPKTEKFDLAVTPILIWMGLAAIGGIVGSVSYDLIKVAFKRITRKHDKIEIYCKGKTDFEKKKITIGLQLVATLELTDEEFRSIANGVQKRISESKKFKRIEKDNLAKRIGEKISHNQD